MCLGFHLAIAADKTLHFEPSRIVQAGPARRWEPRRLAQVRPGGSRSRQIPPAPAPAPATAAATAAAAAPAPAVRSPSALPCSQPERGGGWSERRAAIQVWKFGL